VKLFSNLFNDDFKIVEFINQWSGFEKAYLFSFTLNLIRIILFYLAFGILFYLICFVIILNIFSFEIKGVPLSKVLVYFYICIIIVFSKIN
jgi:hypothetical protein